MGSVFGGGSSGGKSSSSSGSVFGGGAKKKQQEDDDGFLGTGVGPSLHSMYKGVTEAPGKLADTAGGLATGLASAAYHTGKAGVNLMDIGLANATGNDPSRYWNQLHGSLHHLGEQSVGMVTGASSALGDVADAGSLRFIPGVADLENKVGYNPGATIRDVVGTGLADVGGIAAGKIHLNPLTPDDPQNVATLQYMGTHPEYGLNQGSFGERVKSQGYVNATLADVGNLAIVAKGVTPALAKGADLAEGAGHSGLASTLDAAAQASKVAEHPLKNTIGRPFAPLTRAAFEARTAADITDTGANVADSPANGVESFNHDPVVAQYHDQYGREHGAAFPGQVDTARTMPPELGAQLADAYQQKPTSLEDLTPAERAATQAAYDKMIPEVKSQYEFLTKPESEGGMGVNVEVVDRASNPYANPDGTTNFKKMLTDIQHNKHLYVDATSPDEAHPYMTPEENNQFRAVHDAFGHSRAGNDFGPNGEEVAYQHHAQMFSPEAQRALAMETRGQNATLNFSPDNLARAAAGFGKEFDVQRVGLLPEEMSHPDYTKPPEAPPVSAVPEHPENVPLHSAAEAGGPKVPNMPDGAQTVEGLSPTAAEFAKRQATPIPEWAKKTIEKLGGGEGKAAKVLARAEDTKRNRTARIIKRELQRGGIEVPAKLALHEPFMEAMTKGVLKLQEENKGLAPEEASRMFGQAVKDRLEGTDKLPGGPGHHVLLPDAMRTPAIEEAINTAVGHYDEFAARTKEGYAASDTHGARGLPEDGSVEPSETKQVAKLTKAIDRLTEQARKAGERVPKEVERLKARREAILDRAAKLDEKVKAQEDIRNAAAERLAGLREHVETPEPKAVPVESATPAVRESAAPDVYHDQWRDAQGREFYDIPNQDRPPLYRLDRGSVEVYDKNLGAEDFPDVTDQRRGDWRDVTPEEAAKLNESGQLRGMLRDELIRNGDEADAHGVQYNRSTGKFEVIPRDFSPGEEAKAQAFADNLNIAEVPKEAPRPETKMVMPEPKTAAQMVRATPAEPNPVVADLKQRIANARARLAALPTEAAARRGTSVISSDMHEEITSLKQTIKDSQAQLAKELVQEPANAALNRGVNLAYSARDIADATQRIADTQKQQAAHIAEADKLQTQIDAADTKSSRVQAKYEQVRAKRVEQLNKALDTAPVSHWPRQLQPAGRAYMQMLEDAKSDPELARLVKDAEPTWRSFMQHANALGMDPKYVANMTPDQVRALMKVSPDFEMGRTMVSGARKAYNGALSGMDAADNSIEAFAAARTAMHQEIVQNMMAGYMKDNFAIPVKAGDVISHDLVSFDPENRFMPEPREHSGGWRAPRDGYVIPKALASAIRLSEKDYGHWFQRANKFVLNPWRNAVITASPQFYVNHTIGHAVLATIEGVHLDHWVKAWNDYKANDPHGIYNQMTGHSAVGQGTSLEPTLEGPTGIRDAMGRAEAQGTTKATAAVHATAAKLHRVTNFVDSMARTATYIAKREKGFSEAEALNKAYSNLVDYNDLSPFEQNIVRAVVPFYSFQKAIFKIVGKFPVDHPAVLGLAANFGRVNQQQLSDRFGTSFPQGYAGLIDTGNGGTINTHGINPFKDATSLASVDGIVQALNPAIAIVARAGFNAPSGGYVQGRKVDDYGNLVPDVNPVDELKDQASFLPFVSGAASVLGEGTKGPIRGPLAKFGVNINTPEEMQKLAERIKGSRDAAASGAPFAGSSKGKKSSSVFG